jgi:hypothetical protein
MMVMMTAAEITDFLDWLALFEIALTDCKDSHSRHPYRISWQRRDNLIEWYLTQQHGVVE